MSNLVRPEGSTPRKHRELSQFEVSLWRIIQTGITIASGLILLGLLLNMSHVTVPGTPAVLYWLSVAVALSATVVLAPPVFFRLSRGRQGWAYAYLLVSLIVMLVAVSEVDDAYSKTPARIKEVAEEQARRAKEAAVELREADKLRLANRAARALQERRDAPAKALADAAATKKKLEEYVTRIESCFTTFGHRLPVLEETVRASLHNPDAFKHIETVAVTPDADNNNIIMTFRAENGFGAIRTAHVEAQLVADGCEVQNIGTAEES